MYRLRSLVLVPALVLAGACSRGDDRTATSSPLDRDLTLSAQLQRSEPSGLPELALGGACQREAAPKAPTASQRAQAAALEQRAAEAEFVGNIGVARDLHRQAARLDGTSEEIAYRLARADEASGDRTSAVKNYCRYLSLAPTAANARDARARLSALLPAAATVQMATNGTPQAAPAAQAQRSPRTVARAVRTPARQSQTTYASAPAPVPASPTVAEPTGSSAPSQGVPTETDGNVYASSTGEVVPPQAEPVSVPREETSARRAPDHTARNAAIGAAAGAAVGAMVSRSVKGAVIGGVAGGVLGAVVGRGAGRNSGFRTPGWAR